MRPLPARSSIPAAFLGLTIEPVRGGSSYGFTSTPFGRGYHLLAWNTEGGRPVNPLPLRHALASPGGA